MNPNRKRQLSISQEPLESETLPQPLDEEEIDRFDPTMLKAENVCALLQVTERTLKKWQSEGRLQFYPIGGSIRFLAEDVHTFIKRNRALLASQRK